MHARAYLRASTSEQDAGRARPRLRRSPSSAASPSSERMSRTSPARSWRVPSSSACWLNSRPGDALLVEQVDRLSRLTDSDWRRLRAELDAKEVRVVALDLPTSWQMAAPSDEFTGRMFAAINGMMLDMLAAVARKDYDDRRRRQAQGVAKAKAEGKYRGRPEDADRNAGIAGMLRSGMSWTAIQAAVGCSRATIAKVAKRDAGA